MSPVNGSSMVCLRERGGGKGDLRACKHLIEITSIKIEEA